MKTIGLRFVVLSFVIALTARASSHQEEEPAPINLRPKAPVVTEDQAKALYETLKPVFEKEKRFSLKGFGHPFPANYEKFSGLSCSNGTTAFSGVMYQIPTGFIIKPDINQPLNHHTNRSEEITNILREIWYSPNPLPTNVTAVPNIEIPYYKAKIEFGEYLKAKNWLDDPKGSSQARWKFMTEDKLGIALIEKMVNLSHHHISSSAGRAHLPDQGSLLRELRKMDADDLQIDKLMLKSLADEFESHSIKMAAFDKKNKRLTDLGADYLAEHVKIFGQEPIREYGKEPVYPVPKDPNFLALVKHTEDNTIFESRDKDGNLTSAANAFHIANNQWAFEYRVAKRKPDGSLIKYQGKIMYDEYRCW